MRFGVIFSVLVLIFSTFALANWTQTAGPTGSVVTAFAVNPTNGHVFAATKGGVFRSNDGGATWVWANGGLDAGSEIAAIASLGTRSFASCPDPLSGAAVVYYSTDEGGTWTRTNGTFGSALLPSVASLLVTPTRVIAGVGAFSGPGMFYSTDNGDSWTMGTGVAVDFYSANIVSNGAAIFAGGSIGNAFGKKGVFHSVNEGTSWVADTTFPNSGVTGMAVIGSTVFAGTNLNGAYKTVDNGAHWTKINPSAQTGFCSAMAASGTKLYIGLYGPMYTADVAGGNWASASTGLPPTYAGSVINAAAVSGSNILCSVTNYGIFRSTDAGANWSKANVNLRNSGAGDVYADGATLYAASAQTGFFKSTNDGDSWTEINSGVDFTTNSAFGGFAKSGSYLIGLSSGRSVLRSSDGGSTWANDATGVGSAFYTVIADGADLYAAGLGNVWKSTDNGATWTAFTTGLAGYNAMRALYKEGDVIITGGLLAFKRSTDNGATWSAPVAGIQTAYTYNGFAKIDSTIFTCADGGIYASTNLGANWTATHSPGPGGNPNFTLLAVNNVLYVGTKTGVYRSTDKGGNWAPASAGLGQNLWVQKLSMNANYIFAHTKSSGVWRRPLSELTAVGNASDVQPAQFVLHQNYPNPFNPATQISYSLPVRSTVRITLFNVLGQTVGVLQNGVENQGEKTVSWNAGTLASGMYFYRLEAVSVADPNARLSEVRKMVLAR